MAFLLCHGLIKVLIFIFGLIAQRLEVEVQNLGEKTSIRLHIKRVLMEYEKDFYILSNRDEGFYQRVEALLLLILR